MESLGLHPNRVYTKRLHTTIVERVAYRPVYAMCTEAERITRTIRFVRWWDQDAVNEPEQ